MNEVYFSQLREIIPTVSRETAESLFAFEALFYKWSKTINLASFSTRSELWMRHILDSVQLYSLQPEAQKWLDLGTGGGFPGMVLAILLKEKQNAFIDLIESNHKKAAFLKTAIAQIRARGKVHADRIDVCWSRIPVPEIITARAVAPLKTLFLLAEPWLSAGATALFQKGRDYHREIEESRNDWVFDLIEYPSVFGEKSVILQINHLTRIKGGAKRSCTIFPKS